MSGQDAITAEQLAMRAGRDLYRPARPDELRRWLIEQRLAEPTPAGLRPTQRAREIGGTLQEVERDSGRGR